MTNAYNTTRTQNVERMYMRVVVQKQPVFSINKGGEEVWRFESDALGYCLFHYRTFILFIGHDGSVRNGHGYSRTDARNINGMLELFNIRGIRAHIKDYKFRLD